MEISFKKPTTYFCSFLPNSDHISEHVITCIIYYFFEIVVYFSMIHEEKHKPGSLGIHKHIKLSF